MADHLRRTRILAVVVGAWALVTTASALATAFWIFFATRLVLGAANNIDNPAASSLLADYYPARVRGRVFGYQRVANTMGAAFGILVGGVLGQWLGWRAPFLVMVVPGVVVAAMCLSLREPERGESERLDAEAAGSSAPLVELETRRGRAAPLASPRVPPRDAGGAADPDDPAALRRPHGHVHGAQQHRLLATELPRTHLRAR